MLFFLNAGIGKVSSGYLFSTVVQIDSFFASLMWREKQQQAIVISSEFFLYWQNVCTCICPDTELTRYLLIWT